MTVCVYESVVMLTYFLGFAVSQWLGIRLQMLGVAMVTGVAFIAVLEHHLNTVDPGNVATPHNKWVWSRCSLQV